MAQGTFTSPIYLFGSIRGGAGKTTLVVDLAIYLNARGRRVAVIDANAPFPMQFRSAIPKGVSLETYADVGELLASPQSRFRRSFFFTNTDRISLFPAHRLGQAGALVTDTGLRDFLLQVRSTFDVVMVNLPPGTEAFAEVETFTGRAGKRFGTAPLAVLVSNADQKSLAAFDALLRERPAIGHLLRERLVVVFNKVPRGVEDQNIANPVLTLADIRRLFPLPAAVGLPFLEDVPRQAIEPAPLVLADRSPVRQAVATLARFLADLHDAPTPWDLSPEPDPFSPSLDPVLLGRLSPLVDRLQATVARRLFVPHQGVATFLDASDRKVRIRVRLARNTRPNFPPLLDVDHRQPRRPPGEARPSFTAIRAAIGRRSTYREPLQTPRISAKPLYQFDDRFALRTEFVPSADWEYVSQPRQGPPPASAGTAEETAVAAPDLHALGGILELGRSIPLTLAYRHFQVGEAPPPIRHFFLPPEFPLWVRFGCARPDDWWFDPRPNPARPVEPRHRPEPRPAALDRPLVLVGDIPDLFQRNWELALVAPIEEFPPAPRRERFAKVERAFAAGPPAGRLRAPRLFHAQPRDERPEVPPLPARGPLRLIDREPMVRPVPGLLEAALRGTGYPSRLEPRLRREATALEVRRLLRHPEPAEPVFFSSPKLQMLTPTATDAPRPAPPPGLLDYREEARPPMGTFRPAWRAQGLRGRAAGTEPVFRPPAGRFGMEPFLIGHRFGLVPWWGTTMFRDRLPPDKAFPGLRAGHASLPVHDRAWRLPVFAAMPPALPTLPRLSFTYRESLWSFRNLRYQGLSIHTSGRHGIFPARLPARQPPAWVGIPRWFREPFAFSGELVAGAQLRLRLPPLPRPWVPSSSPTHAGWLGWKRGVILRVTEPAVRTVAFFTRPGPAGPPEPLFQERPDLGLCLFARGVPIRPDAEELIERGARTLAYPPPHLRLLGYVPTEAWFHISSKTFTLVSFHLSSFRIDGRRERLAVACPDLPADAGRSERPVPVGVSAPPRFFSPLRHRHPGLPEVAPGRPAIGLPPDEERPSLRGTARHLPDFPPPFFPEPRFRMPDFRLRFIPWRMRGQDIRVLAGRGEMPVPPPDVCEVLFRNLHERWQAWMASPIAFRVSRPQVDAADRLAAGRAVVPPARTPCLPDLRTRPFRTPKRMDTFRLGGMRIMTARLRDLLQVARQTAEVPHRLAPPGQT
ncbi:MAG: hypothetical protein GX442_18995 [Candidatus Riflebacteria bacterium]|nr:hypothetical protein [Candidatus Riflebacteria bacterium]